MTAQVYTSAKPLPRLPVAGWVWLMIVGLILFLPSFYSSAGIAGLASFGAGTALSMQLARGIIRASTLLHLTTFLFLCVIALQTRSSAVNQTLFLVEAKLLFVPPLYVAMERFLRLSPGDARAVFYLFSRGFVAINLVLFIWSGFAFRYIQVNQPGSLISIYAAVVLVGCFALEKDLRLRALITVLVGFLGSGTGLLALLTVLGYEHRHAIFDFLRGRALLYLPLVVALLALFLVYNAQVRGRSIFDYESIDRFQLSAAGVRYALETGGVRSLLLGYGVGSELVGIYQFFDPFASVVPWLKSSRAVDGFTGLVFHNEYLRVFSNFGLVGFGLVFLSTRQAFAKSGVLAAALFVISWFGSSLYVSQIIVPLLFLAHLQAAMAGNNLPRVT